MYHFGQFQKSVLQLPFEHETWNSSNTDSNANPLITVHLFSWSSKFPSAHVPKRKCMLYSWTLCWGIQFMKGKQPPKICGRGWKKIYILGVRKYTMSFFCTLIDLCHCRYTSRNRKSKCQEQASGKSKRLPSILSYFFFANRVKEIEVQIYSWYKIYFLGNWVNNLFLRSNVECSFDKIIAV